MTTILAKSRVLDLTNERGQLCAQVLADLGADVIKIEPPGGSRARKLGPFYNDEQSPESSLFFWAYNRDKRGVTLDIEREEARELLKRLIKSADFFIESEQPGYLAERGLGYDQLSKLNPRLIYISITPFGQNGPKMSYADADLVILAAGGPLALTGDDDRPPVRLGAVPQAYLHASMDAAVAAMAANHERVRSGLGQHIDVSAQQSVAMAAQSYILSPALNSAEVTRYAGGVKLGPFCIPLVWPAKDGYISLAVLFGSALGPFTRRLMEYICERGFCDQATRDKDWIGYVELLFSGTETIEEWTRVTEVVRNFTRSHTKAELLKLALERGFLIAPVWTVKEVVESPQLAARNYFQEVEHPEHGRSFRYPGPFVKFGATPIEYRRRPPRVGEHNREVYRTELGLNETEVAELERRGVI